VARAAGDTRGTAEAEARLAGLARQTWGPQDWTWSRGTARLEMMTGAPAAGFAVPLQALVVAWSVVESTVSAPAIRHSRTLPPTFRSVAWVVPSLKVSVRRPACRQVQAR